VGFPARKRVALVEIILYLVIHRLLLHRLVVGVVALAAALRQILLAE
jgi:hypothetical protein